MAYNKENMIKQSITAIKKHKLIYVEEILAFVSFSKPTFYAHKLNESDDIIKEIANIKIKGKHILRTKWEDSKSPFLQTQLYKLYANDDELARLKATEKKEDKHNSEFESIDFEYTLKSDNKPLYA